MGKAVRNNFTLTKKDIIITVLGLIIGWFSHIGLTTYDNYFNRAVLSLKIQSLTVNECQKDNWEMQIVFKIENTGNSEALINIKDCNVAFPLLKREPIRIEYNKNLSLNQRSSINDTITIQLPNFFGRVDIDKFYSFNFIELSVEELRTREKYISKRDSSELILKGKVFLEKEKVPTVKDFITTNAKSGDSILVRGIHNILYKGKVYKNYFFPSDAKVSCKIKDDMIMIEFLSEANKPFLYLPADELKDKIIMPDRATFKGSIEQETEMGKKYKNFELTKGPKYGDMYFFLFKE